MSNKNYKFEIIGRDFNSYLIRNEIWVRAFFHYPELFNIARLVAGIVSRDNNIEYVTDMSVWRKCHEDIKSQIMNDHYWLEKIIDQIIATGKDMNEWTEKNIFNIDLAKLDNMELWRLYNEFARKQSEMYSLGVIMPICDFQNFSFVERNLEKILRTKLPANEYGQAFGVFSRPVSNSFAQDQEEDLLKMISKYYGLPGWKEAIANLQLSGLQKAYTDFYRDLSEHTKKYAWVYYVYSGPAYSENDFINFIKDFLRKNIAPEQKIAELKNEFENYQKNKSWYLQKINPDLFEKSILELAGKMVRAKPRRKDFQSKSYYHVEKIQREIGTRLFLTLSQVRSTPLYMVEAGLKGGNLDLDLINEIEKFHVVLPNDDGTTSILTNGEAEKFLRKISVKKNENKIADIKEIRGSCAYVGKAKGKVKVINSIGEMSKMEYGDILVSCATTPAIVMAMKKAAAIVTDEGGLTCHASIVSRELHIPCVVGTKIATQVLKDGDMVEVDANSGVAKRI